MTPERTKKVMNALAVIIKTPHIFAYLLKSDPQALRQAQEAYCAALTEEAGEKKVYDEAVQS